jgi:hypothetical protein
MLAVAASQARAAAVRRWELQPQELAVRPEAELAVLRRLQPLSLRSLRSCA